MPVLRAFSLLSDICLSDFQKFFRIMSNSFVHLMRQIWSKYLLQSADVDKKLGIFGVPSISRISMFFCLTPSCMSHDLWLFGVFRPRSHSFSPSIILYSFNMPKPSGSERIVNLESLTPI